jgi:chromosome partitioning protein
MRLKPRNQPPSETSARSPRPGNKGPRPAATPNPSLEEESDNTPPEPGAKSANRRGGVSGSRRVPVGGTGWPPVATPRRGGYLRLVDGFLVFVPPHSGTETIDGPNSRGLERSSAVGWPRGNSAERAAGVHSPAPADQTRTAPAEAAEVTLPPDAIASSLGEADTPRADRDDTVHDNGSHDPGATAPHVSRETGPDGWAVGGRAQIPDPGLPHPRVESGRSNSVNAAADGTGAAPRVPLAVPFSSPDNGTSGAHPGRPDVAERPPAPAPRPQPAPSTDRVDVAPPRPAEPRTDTPAAAPEVIPEEAVTDAYVSRETPTREEDDPPLAMEALRAVQILNPSGEITMPRPDHTRIMCVANQKGGVGKTTSTVNLAVGLALHGNRVLVVDLDPQGNASTGLNVPHHAGIPDVYDCLIDNVPLSDVAQAVEGIPNLWCVPATIDLAGAEIELVSVVARESRLSRAITAHPDTFDYVFIDCPPSLGLLTVNALVAAQEVLIPIQCEYYALEGLNQLINNINLVRQHLNPTLDVSTILLTMYDRRTRLADAVEQDVRNHFGDKVLRAVIPRNVRVSEAPSYGQSVMTYDPGSRGATSYFEAAQEIAERGVKGGKA